MTARDWLAGRHADPAIALVGAPISKASISPSEAWSTPPAFREGLGRFPTWDAEHRADLETLGILDCGDVDSDRDEPDARAAHRRIAIAVTTACAAAPIVVVIGGDNSLTRPAFHAVRDARPEQTLGLVTLDAHHDVRPADAGPRNGTPVRELIEAGLPGPRVAQVGIHPFGNAREHTAWAESQGIHIQPLAAVRDRGGDAIRNAIGAVTGAGATAVYVDFDIDVADRAFAPACPASMPGGMTPRDLCEAAYTAGADRRVVACDLCEVDANRDVNGMTVRLMAQVFLSFCAGVASREQA